MKKHGSLQNIAFFMLARKALLRVSVLICCISSACIVQAQIHPNNPYNAFNRGFQDGYRKGQEMAKNIAKNNKYGRDQLRKTINKWGSCNNGALSLEYGAVALYGSNGYFCSSTVNSYISSKLKELNKNGGTINDINITENGQYIIVYNETTCYGVVPEALSAVWGEFPYGTKYKSVSFNENGIYAIVTSTGFRSNNAIYQSFYDDNVEEFGELYSVFVCGEGAVFCYSNGTKYCGRIPQKVESAIRSFSGTPSFVKFNKHGDYLICSKSGAYAYYINDADQGSNDPTVFYDYAKERKKKLKEKAFAKWDSKAYYDYDDVKKTHRVCCERMKKVDGHYLSLNTSIGTAYNDAPTLNIDFELVSNTDFQGIMENLSNDGLEHMSLKIELSNGEIITTNGMSIYKIIYQNLGEKGFRLSTSLVDMRSDKYSLRGDLASVKYIIGQLSYYDIKSITFKGRYTVDFSNIDTKSQLCYDFYRLANEAGRTNILPN